MRGELYRLLSRHHIKSTVVSDHISMQQCVMRFMLNTRAVSSESQE